MRALGGAYATLKALWCPQPERCETVACPLTERCVSTPDCDRRVWVFFPARTRRYDRIPLPRPELLYRRELYGLQPDWVVFACPQSAFKLHPDFDAALAAYVSVAHEVEQCANASICRAVISQACVRGVFECPASAAF